MLRKSLYSPPDRYDPIVGVVDRIGETAGRYRRLLVTVTVAGNTEVQIEVLADRRVTDVPERLPVSLILQEADWSIRWDAVNTPADETPWTEMEVDPERVAIGVPVRLDVSFPEMYEDHSLAIAITDIDAHVVIPPAYVTHPPIIEVGDRIAIGRVGGTWFYLGPDVEVRGAVSDHGTD